MKWRQMLTGLVVATLVTLPLTACASKFKITGKKMCEASGGTYNAQQHHCTYTQKTMTAKDMCQNHNGYWDTAAGMCEIGRD